MVFSVADGRLRVHGGDAGVRAAVGWTWCAFLASSSSAACSWVLAAGSSLAHRPHLRGNRRRCGGVRGPVAAPWRRHGGRHGWPSARGRQVGRYREHGARADPPVHAAGRRDACSPSSAGWCGRAAASTSRGGADRLRPASGRRARSVALLGFGARSAGPARAP